MATERGDGELRYGTAKERVRYLLETYLSGGLWDGAGRVDADHSVLTAAMQAGKATLVLSDGSLAPILITWLRFGSPAEFQLAGAITDAEGVYFDRPDQRVR